MLSDLIKQRKDWLDKQTEGHKEGEINPWATIKQQPESLSEAIKCECYCCVGEDHDQNPTGRIRNCAISSCPLWLLRPYRSGSIRAAIQAACATAPQAVKKAVLDPITRARTKPQSRTLAIRAYCWQCQGGGGNTNTAQLVATCENYKCGLWNIRPYQKKTDALEKTADDDFPDNPGIDSSPR